MCDIIQHVDNEITMGSLQFHIVESLNTTGTLSLEFITASLEKLMRSDDDDNPLKILNPNELFSSIVQSAVTNGTLDFSKYIIIKDQLADLDRLNNKLELLTSNTHFVPEDWEEMVTRLAKKTVCKCMKRCVSV